jgi:hypothetical protein
MVDWDLSTRSCSIAILLGNDRDMLLMFVRRACTLPSKMPQQLV